METLREVAALAAVFGLLAAVRWYAGRRGGVRMKNTAGMELIGRLPLTPHHTLHLVRVGEVSLLVASSPGGCVLLESRARPRPQSAPGQD